MKKAIFTLLVINFTFFIASAQQASDLDLTFSSDGKQTTDIGGQNDKNYSVAIQADGKIVLAGFSENGSYNEFAVVRCNTDGSLDNTFSSDGKQTTDIGSTFDFGQSVAIQTDGKIVVAGVSFKGTYSDFAIVRYNSDGSLDNTFSGDGIQTTSIGSNDDKAQSVAIQSDGKIVVAGGSVNGDYYNFAIVRYNSNGSLDNTFSSDGIQITAIGSLTSYAYSVAIQPNGKIVVAGYSDNGTNKDFAIIRYNSDGSLDNTFSGDGMQTTAIGSGNEDCSSVAIQKDGKIVAVGSSHNGTKSDFAVVRYNSDGSMDNTFSDDGKQTTSIGSFKDVGYSVAIQANGKIVVAGSSNKLDDDFALIRYNSDGSLDKTFSGDGIHTTDINSADVGRSVAIQSDGKIVVAGWSGNTYSDFTVLRYKGDGGAGIQTEITNPKSEINIFPNPANDVFTLEIKQLVQNEPLNIYNVFGEVVYSEIINGTTIKSNIDCSHLSKGIYFIRLAGNTKRVIIE